MGFRWKQKRERVLITYREELMLALNGRNIVAVVMLKNSDGYVRERTGNVQNTVLQLSSGRLHLYNTTTTTMKLMDHSKRTPKHDISRCRIQCLRQRSAGTRQVGRFCRQIMMLKAM